MDKADILIVGAGCAGLAAAIYGVRAGYTVKLIDKAMYGGQLQQANVIDNYPGMPGITGYALCTAMMEQAIALGAERIDGELIKAELSGTVKTVHTTNGDYIAKSVILATGSVPRKLTCKGADRLDSKGISYCATCDGMLYKNKPVAVVGGGNVAVDDAITLSAICSEVVLIHRRETFRADAQALTVLRKKSNVRLLTNCVVSEITGADAVSGVVYEHTVTGETAELPVSAVFTAIGRLPGRLNWMRAGIFWLMSSAKPVYLVCTLLAIAAARKFGRW